MDVYKDPGSPYWYYDITVNGERERRSTRRTKKSEAEAVARARRQEILDRTQLGVSDTLTLRQALFDHYLPDAKAQERKSYVHLERYCRTLCGDRPGTASLGGDLSFHEITSSLLRTYRNKRRAEGMSEQSVDHEIKVVSAAYNLIKKDFRVRPNLEFPLARVQGKARYLTTEEEQALLDDLNPQQIRGRGGKVTFIRPLASVAKQRQGNYDLVVMLLDTGCRYNEIARLTWGMVDINEFAAIRIYRWKVDSEAHLATTARMREVLRRRYAERGNSHYVFKGWHQDGDDAPRQTTAAIRRAMNRVGINRPECVARFGRRDVRSLRDTFASKLVTHGADLYRVQKLLGHTTPQMTQKYAHLAVDQASTEAVGLLDQLNGADQ